MTHWKQEVTPLVSRGLACVIRIMMGTFAILHWRQEFPSFAMGEVCIFKGTWTPLLLDMEEFSLPSSCVCVQLRLDIMRHDVVHVGIVPSRLWFT